MENEARLLGQAPHRFWLAGLGDQLAYPLGPDRFRGVDDLPGTLASRSRPTIPVILLVHEPDIFTAVPERVALTLAGHTHGGQIRMPLMWPQIRAVNVWRALRLWAYRRNRPPHAGLRRPRLQLCPARLGVPPEVVTIELG